MVLDYISIKLLKKNYEVFTLYARCLSGLWTAKHLKKKKSELPEATIL